MCCPRADDCSRHGSSTPHMRRLPRHLFLVSTGCSRLGQDSPREDWGAIEPTEDSKVPDGKCRDEGVPGPRRRTRVVTSFWRKKCIHSHVLLFSFSSLTISRLVSMTQEHCICTTEARSRSLPIRDAAPSRTGRARRRHFTVKQAMCIVVFRRYMYILQVCFAWLHYKSQRTDEQHHSAQCSVPGEWSCAPARTG